jgi:DNA gyrase subunit A
VADVRATGRNTSGVRFATPDRGDSITGIARNAEHADPDEVEPLGGDEGAVNDSVPLQAVEGAPSPEPGQELEQDPASVPSAEHPDGVPSDGGRSDDAPRTDGVGADDGSAEPGGDE